MLYLNHKNFENFRINWKELIDIIYTSTSCLKRGDFAQPVKPYLRFGDKKNRIIAMPSYVGGDNQAAGIKWISSFPDNHKRNIPRAHSVTVLNDTLTGVPFGIINTALVSAIRTAAVSGAVMCRFVHHIIAKSSLNIGVIGFGVIGKMHIKMALDLLKNSIGKIYVYDINIASVSGQNKFDSDKIEFVNSWEELYVKSDITITCTVSEKRYINLPPPKNSLQLNVSLRDYDLEATKHIDCVVVDNWEEVCRENTDVEYMVMNQQLKKEDSLSIFEYLLNDKHLETFKNKSVIMFNPMGMAIYDIAIGKYFIEHARKLNIGQVLKN